MRLRARAVFPLLIAVAAVACGGSESPAPTGSGSVGPDGQVALDTTTPLPDPLPVVAARVNGQDVPTRNVIIIAESRLQRLEIRDRIVAYRTALQEVIGRELMFQAAVAEGIEPDAEQLKQAYDTTRAGYRDDESWKMFLGQEGLNEELFRTELRVQHTVNAYVRQLERERPIEVSDDEAREFYEANPEMFESGERMRARHILVRVAPDAPDDVARQAESRAREARRRIAEAGEDFAQVARNFSDDAGSAGRGGELAVFVRGGVPKEFADVAYAMEVGQLSEVFRGPYGYHIVEVLEKLPSEKASYEEVVEPLKQRLAASKREQLIRRTVVELRARASIETFI